MKNRDTLHRNYKLDKQNYTSEVTYRLEKKRVKSLMSDKMKEHYKNEFVKNKGNIKGTWNVIDKIIPKSKKGKGLLDEENQDSLKKAEEFNKYFAEIGEIAFNKSQEQIPQNADLTNNQAPLSNSTAKFRPQPVDLNSLILVIKHLKPTNSYGSDGMPYRFIIDSLPVTVFYILIIINTSIV